MSTIVGLETEGGTVLAGDRGHVEGGTKVSEGVRRVFDVDDAAAAAVGEPGAIDEFGRRFETQVREYGIEHGGSIGIGRLARTASEIAKEVGVDAIVSARDDEATARIRSIGRDGAVLSDSAIAFGTGAQVALGRLEDVEIGADVDDAEARVREIFGAIAERDAETGDEIDVWTLENENDD